ncbi:MAG: HTTM domain-containing protein [Myxococcota bacterium]
MIARAWANVEAWVDEREPVTWMALFRIAIGLVVLNILASITLSGVLPVVWYPIEDGGLGRLAGDWRVAWLGGPSPRVTHALMTGALLGGLSLVLGVGSRVGALVAGQCMIALFSLQPRTGGGHDMLLANALWLLVLAPADRSLSLTAWWRTGRLVDPTRYAAWPRALVCYQITVVYALTGLQKASPEWWPWGGLDAVYRSLLQQSYAKADWSWIVSHYFGVTQLMTIGTVLWEAGFPMLLVWAWARRRGHAFGRWPMRTVFLGTGIVVHGLLWLTLDLGPFPFVTLAFYFAWFDEHDWARVGGLLRPGRAGYAPS